MCLQHSGALLASLRWVAQLFLWGSAAWVLNGHFLLFPGDGPSEKLNTYFTAYSVLVGGTLFWTGAYLAVLEALNAALEVKVRSCPEF